MFIIHIVLLVFVIGHRTLLLVDIESLNTFNSKH